MSYVLARPSNGRNPGQIRHSILPKPALLAVIFDAAGNRYGTAYEGGVAGFGAVFELTP